jgi:putative Mg2+ transporter-C (MgtC) family protein
VLLPTAGRQPDSFVMNDLMRLPLGILTGVGFIGGGAIVKRGDNVQGLTTAATLWFVTVVGLCFGGGQIGLGVAGGVLGLLILRALKLLELKLKQKRASQLRLKWKAGEYDAAQAMSTLRHADLEIASFSVRQDAIADVEELSCSVRRLARPEERSFPPVVAEVVGRQGVIEWEWTD